MGFPYKEKSGNDREGASVLPEDWKLWLITTLNNAYRTQFILLVFAKYLCLGNIFTSLQTFLVRSVAVRLLEVVCITWIKDISTGKTISKLITLFF